MRQRRSPAVRFARVPKTQLTFVNVPLMPVKTRAGEARYMSATWGGAFYLFDRQGRATIIPLPEGTFGTYSFVPDVEPGFAWVLFSGGKLAQVDVDAARIVFMQDVPLEKLNWSAAMTRDGLLVCSAHPGDVMVYDTRRRAVKFMFTPISPVNHSGKYLQAAPDGCVIVPMAVPGAEWIRLDPRTGKITRTEAGPYRLEKGVLPASVTLLPDGRYAAPQARHVALLRYPDFEPLGTLAYPSEAAGWKSFRTEEDGRLFAYRDEGGPLYRLGDGDRWDIYLKRFPLECGRARLTTMFSALPGNRLLALSPFGELVEYDPDGTPRLVAELDNLAHQRLCALAPGDGAHVFTTTFINSSFQELNMETGRGRNIRPCQKHAGQVSAAIWFRERLWLACYGGAEISVYDPARGGEWPENPRPFADIGHEQMRPVGLCAEGDALWCATHAQYGKYGGGLARIDAASGACQVWRDLLPGHNPTGIVLDRARGRIYGGTTVWPDQQSAPAADGPGGVFAFDLARRVVAWTAQPVAGADGVVVETVYRGTVIASTPGRLIVLRAEDGRVERIIQAELPPGDPAPRLFTGGDGELYLASAKGLFCYDLDRGPGERLIEGAVDLPRVRGADLFFVREHEVGVAEGLWQSLSDHRGE